MKKSHFRYWELALLLALAVTILWGAASLGQQEELGRKVIRLHVIANSDSPEDQALKLRVRDRVLARAQEILEQSADMEQAEQALTAALPELTREARETLAAEGCAQPVQARLEPAEFPTKDYDGFSLPAEKRFDLIIRTEKEIDNDFCAQIMQLFRTSLSAVDYAGNIRINIKEKFIKLCEDEPEKTILQDGIFI